MNNFTFSIPQNINFGLGEINKTGELSKKLNIKKALIVSDRMLEKLGIVEKIEKILKDSGIESECYLDIEPNPSVETVNKAVEVYKKSSSDGIIALGGGSPMDVAKAVGVLATYGGDITEYEGADKVPGDISPIIAIPTTAGTGSEVTAFSVITDTKRNYKLTVFSYKLIPAYAVLDPELIMSLPPSVAASTGIDALVHAIESYLSLAASPFSDAMAEKAISLIGENIRKFVANRNNKEAASAMMSGSTFAGIAFAWARLGNVHAMAHPLGGFFHIPHGVANAVLLPVIMEYNSLSDGGKYKKIYSMLTGKNPEEFESSMLTEEIKRLLIDLDIPKNLSELGVTEDKIPEMAADAMKSGNILVNPRQSTLKDIEMLYKKAMY